MNIVLADDAIRVGASFQLTFQRTLRIPDDGRTYPLPPGLGRFPLFPCTSYGAHAEADWQSACCFFLPMYQREAMWVGFGNSWPPVAVKVAAGGVNAISGQPDAGGLSARPQNYVVCPEQLWLDGINTGPATIRQFVAVPLGAGLSIEAAITGRERKGGMQIEIYAPRPGAQMTKPTTTPPSGPARHAMPRMGLGAGGRVTQKIYPDPHGIDCWTDAPAARLALHILSCADFRAITGTEPPPTPIDARTYSERGLPWFHLYEEDKADVPAPEAFQNIRTVAQGDPGRRADESVDIEPRSIRSLGDGDR